MSLNTIADMIEVEQAELRLPEGIEWPRWSTGELIKFGDVVETTKGPKKVLGIRFNIREYELYENRCEGPFIWASYGVKLKHSEPDTAESILSEMVSAIECEGCVELDPYIERYRKLMGGE